MFIRQFARRITSIQQNNNNYFLLRPMDLPTTGLCSGLHIRCEFPHVELTLNPMGKRLVVVITVVPLLYQWAHALDVLVSYFTRFTADEDSWEDSLQLPSQHSPALWKLASEEGASCLVSDLFLCVLQWNYVSSALGSYHLVLVDSQWQQQ